MSLPIKQRYMYIVPFRYKQKRPSDAIFDVTHEDMDADRRLTTTVKGTR